MRRPSDHVLARAYGEARRELPIVIQATQNILAKIGAPIDAVDIHSGNCCMLVGEIVNPYLRERTIEIGREIYREKAA